MLKVIDRTCAVVLGLGAAVGHTYGSFKAYGHDETTLLWALNASVLGLLLGALNLLRSARPDDRALAAIVGAGTVCWIISAARFGFLIDNPLDPRVLMFLLVSVILVLFNLQTAMGSSGTGTAVRLTDQ
jgi:hypothetical protein